MWFDDIQSHSIEDIYQNITITNTKNIWCPQESHRRRKNRSADKMTTKESRRTDDSSVQSTDNSAHDNSGQSADDSGQPVDDGSAQSADNPTRTDDNSAHDNSGQSADDSGQPVDDDSTQSADNPTQTDDNSAHDNSGQSADDSGQPVDDASAQSADNSTQTDDNSVPTAENSTRSVENSSEDARKSATNLTSKRVAGFVLLGPHPVRNYHFRKNLHPLAQRLPFLRKQLRIYDYHFFTTTTQTPKISVMPQPNKLYNFAYFWYDFSKSMFVQFLPNIIMYYLQKIFTPNDDGNGN